MRIAVLSLLIVSLAACATPETRLRTGLVNAGLSKPIAACMAERMVDRLSLLQLRRLGSLASLKDKNASDLSLNEFLHKVRALKDPEILTVTTSSAALCAFR
ncbi:MAG: hypothetical protein KIT23_08040 [Sphingopyxis sp.]|nr:hypothetical protein [Sphingopyxis sp.]